MVEYELRIEKIVSYVLNKPEVSKGLDIMREKLKLCSRVLILFND